MKISKIKISKYHQFEDFELDLTYPKGHEKEGQPLDKVCFIGQSGTGKTTLLEMINLASVEGYKNSIIYPKSFTTGNGASFTFENTVEESRIIILKTVGFELTPKDPPDLQPTIEYLLYFPAGIANVLLKNEATEILSYKDRTDNYGYGFHSKYYRFDRNLLEKTWNKYFEIIKNYQIEESNFRIKLTKALEVGNSEVDIKKEIKKWKQENINPAKKVAEECLDKLLNKFNLEVKTEIDDVREKDILPINSINDNIVIPYDDLSTGTKQIIYTAFPIYQLLKPNSIVLMDEPENSLYPDIQKEIIDYYTSFDKEKKSQFFFATHSPIIASSFEPWEIVELKFDEKGRVYRDKYYEGENHVDNYRLDPQILRYDQILTRIFDLTRGSDVKRSEKMQEYSILKNKVKNFTEEELKNPSSENKETIEKYLRLADDLSGTWAISRHEKN